MKKLALFFLLVCSVASGYAQHIQTTIILSQELQDTLTFERSLQVEPSAYCQERILYILYPVSTISKVEVIDKSTDTTVCFEQFEAARQVIFNLSTLSAGEYTLRIYAFGKWWWGEFEIEND